MTFKKKGPLLIHRATPPYHRGVAFCRPRVGGQNPLTLAVTMLVGQPTPA